MTQAVGCVRISTEHQHLSLQAQGERITAWCQNKGLELVAIYFDNGVSGGSKRGKSLNLMDSLQHRPALLATLDALRTGMVLVATQRDRLARDRIAAAMIERLAERSGACVQTCDGTGDGDTPEAKLLRSLVDAFAEYERELIRMRTKNALQHKKRQGKRISGRAPYGCCFTEDGQVIPDPTEQAVIDKARMYADRGLSLRQIAAQLATEGHLSRVGTPLSPMTIRTMVRTVA